LENFSLDIHKNTMSAIKRTVIAGAMILAIASQKPVAQTMEQCASDAVTYYTPIVECIVEDGVKGDLDIISAAQCVKSIAGAETYLSACCKMFENSTNSLMQDVNGLCQDFGFNTAAGPLNFMCVADYADYWDPIVLCLAAQYEKSGSIDDPLECVHGIQGIDTYLNACCSAIDNMNSTYLTEVQSVCRDFNLGN
jgi:hypothetical protein